MARRSLEIITFDCYGTIIDWERGIRSAFAAEAAKDGINIDGDRVVSAYHAIEPEVEAGPFRPYREVLTEVAMRVADRLGWPIDADRARFLAESVPSWPPFEDSAGALDRLSASGFRLGILSNIDDDLLAGTRHHLPEVFDSDLIVTAQRVGSYKPAPGHFEAARDRIGARGWLHAAQSLFHDIQPAARHGIPTAWINRKHEPRPADVPDPTMEVASLALLADRLIRGEAGG